MDGWMDEWMDVGFFASVIRAPGPISMRPNREKITITSASKCEFIGAVWSDEFHIRSASYIVHETK